MLYPAIESTIRMPRGSRRHQSVDAAWSRRNLGESAVSGAVASDVEHDLHRGGELAVQS